MKKLTKRTAVITGTILAAMLLMAGCENTKEPGTEPPTGSLSPTITLAQPTETPEPTPTPVPSVTEPITETPEPTSPVTPTDAPTDAPTEAPSNTPTQTPEAPTEVVTPTVEVATPTKAPTKEPTKEPTKAATPTVTKKATPTPTKKATITPTKKVTAKPTATPTKKPTPTPTKVVTPTTKPKPTNTPKPTATPAPVAVLCKEMLTYTNEARAKEGLKPYTWGEDLEALALKRAKEAVAEYANSTPHAGAQGPENLAMTSYSEVKRTHDLWMNSSGHRAVIMSKVTEDFIVEEGTRHSDNGKIYEAGETVPGKPVRMACAYVFTYSETYYRNMYYWVYVIEY